MRTHYCGQVSEQLLGREVTVAGWVHRRRDHGGVIFVDLRDREGLLQIVFNPDLAAVFAEAERLRNEFVVSVTGTVRERPAGTVNAHLASGKVELIAARIEVLNRLAGQVLRRQHFQSLLVTRGREGMMLYEPGRAPQALSIFGSDQVADVTGAGDTVIAVMALALAASATLVEAANLANLAGGCVVLKFGTAVITPDELLTAVRESNAGQR